MNNNDYGPSEKVINEVINFINTDKKAYTNYIIIIILIGFFISIDLFILMIKSLFKR